MSGEPVSDDSFYARALSRIDIIAIALGCAAVSGLFILQGWRGALGCFIGAVLSFLNLRLWKRLANAIGDAGERPRGGSAALLGLRYLLLGGVIFVIMKYFEVSLLAILAGLLTSVAAVIVEIIYELVFTSHKA